MDPLVPESASDQAVKDWNARAARILVVGTINESVPLFHWGQLFYTESLGCFQSAEAERYCRQYNLTIRSLLERYGIPNWAPAKRLPDAFSCLEYLTETSHPFSSLQPVVPAEAMVLNRILTRWASCSPLIWARLDHFDILLLGGNVSSEVGRIDVIDLLQEPKWMATYQYPHHEFPKLPW